MRDVYIIGVGMTRFGLFMGRNMKSPATEAVTAATGTAMIAERVWQFRGEAGGRQV